MNNYDRHIASKVDTLQGELEAFNRRLETAKGTLQKLKWRSKWYDKRTQETDLENKLHIWNYEEKCSPNPNPKLGNVSRYRLDPVYKKLQGIRNTLHKSKRGLGLAGSNMRRVADYYILSLMRKVEKRKMGYEQYTHFLETPRSQAFPEIFKIVEGEHKKALEEAGYERKRYSHSDKDFEKLRKAEEITKERLNQHQGGMIDTKPFRSMYEEDEGYLMNLLEACSTNPSAGIIKRLGIVQEEPEVLVRRRMLMEFAKSG